MIPGGYYIKARKIMESDIMNKPPVVREMWDWLLMNANHTSKGNIKRGQQIRTLKEIQNGLCWYAGYAKKTYSIKQIRGAYDFLTKGSMVVTTKVTHGMLITICNYNEYQAPENYEGNTAGKPQVKTGAQYKQECKNDKNGKKDILQPDSVSDELWSEFKKLRGAKKAPISELVIKRINTEAKKINWPIEKAIEEMVFRGWTGFKSSWVNKGGDNGKRANSPHQAQLAGYMQADT